MTDRSAEISRLEHLSNEVFYEIFDYLDVFTLYEAFRPLNSRLKNLCDSSHVFYHLDFCHSYKFQLRNFSRLISERLSSRIRSIRFSNYLQLEAFLSSTVHLSNFDKLRFFNVDFIREDQINAVLDFCARSTSLERLFLRSTETLKSTTETFRSILALKSLKVVHLSSNFNLFRSYHEIIIEPNTSIEKVTFAGTLNLDDLLKFLSLTPNVKTVCCDITTQYSSLVWMPYKLEKLNHLRIKVRRTSFDEFENLMSTFATNLEYLDFSAENEMEFLDGKRWENLIRTHLPNLIGLTLEESFRNNESNLDLDEFHALSKSFHSKFFSDRRWFFFHEHFRSSQSDDALLFCTVGSTLKNYKVSESFLCHEDKNRKFFSLNVELLEIRSMEKSSICLEKTRSLTIRGDVLRENSSLLVDLTRRFDPNKLVELFVDSENLRFEQLMIFLERLKNIRTLTIPTTILLRQNPADNVKNRHFTNQTVENLTLIKNCSVQDFQQVLILFSVMKTLQISVNDDYLPFMILFLLKQIDFPRRIRSKAKLNNWKYVISDLPKGLSLVSSFLTFLTVKNVSFSLYLELRTKFHRELSLEYHDQDIHIWL